MSIYDGKEKFLINNLPLQTSEKFGRPPAMGTSKIVFMNGILFRNAHKKKTLPPRN